MKTTAQLAASDTLGALSSLLKAFGDHAEFGTNRDEGLVRLRYGSAHISTGPGTVLVTAEADDEIRLSYVKMAVAEHWSGLHCVAQQPIVWDDTFVEGRLPVFFQPIEVVATRRIAPYMQRITFRGTDFSSYALGGLHVRLLFPPKNCRPVWPTLGADGRLNWPEGPDALAARVYTLRRVDVLRSEIDIDFVLHPTADHFAPGADFAATACPGQVLGIFAPGGNELPHAQSMVLLGDETAMPAMARIVEAIPPDSSAHVFVETDQPGENYDFVSRDGIEVTYLHRYGRPAGSTALLSVKLANICGRPSVSANEDLRFLWAGCEFEDYQRIRRLAREDLRLPRERYSVVAYWRKR